MLALDESQPEIPPAPPPDIPVAEGSLLQGAGQPRRMPPSLYIPPGETCQSQGLNKTEKEGNPGMLRQQVFTE